MSLQPAVRAEQLQMTFVSADSNLEALAEADFAVMPSEFVSIIGPSGCGKSTLLRIIGGLVRPTSGKVVVDGQMVTKPPDQVGFMFQHANLMPWRTTLQNVTLPLEVRGIARSEARQRAQDMLSLVGLRDFAETLPRDLSGGMRQRAALARVLVYDPDILLLDEPFGALDALTREEMNWELLGIWRAKRKTVLMVTHNIEEAIFLSDRVFVMSPRPGRIQERVPIELPRPRSRDVYYSTAFLDLARHLRGLLG